MLPRLRLKWIWTIWWAKCWKRDPMRSRPRGLSQHDFDNIRLVIGKVVRTYRPGERHVPWQPGLQRGNRGTLMNLLKAGDYRAAHGFLVVKADFIPA